MTYRQSLEVVRSHCPFLSPDDLAAVLGGTLAELLNLGSGRMDRNNTPRTEPPR
jgi:hypothetical protein